MKQSTLLLAFFTLLMLGCADHPTSELAIIQDRTDPHRSGPWDLDRSDIEKISGLRDNIYVGNTISLYVINGSRYNEGSKELHLDPGASLLFEQQLSREELLEDHLGRAVEMLRRSKVDMALQHSVVFRRICDVMDQVMNRSADRKIIVIYSDLAENDLQLTVHRNGRVLWDARIDSLRTALLRQRSIPELDGVDVYLIHNPGEDPIEALRFERLALMYKGMLTEHGAQVHIAGSFLP